MIRYRNGRILIMYKQLLDNKLLDYLIKQEYPHTKAGKIVMVQCPCCEREPFSASFVPNVNVVHCIPCNKDISIVDFVRTTEPEYEDKTEEEITEIKPSLIQLISSLSL